MTVLPQLTAEAALLESAGTNRWAQERLYRDWVQFVGHVARAAGARPADLEDVVHDSFLSAFRDLRQLDEPAAFRAWLAKITVRQVNRHRRFRRWLTLFEKPTEEHTAWETLLDSSASPEVVIEVRQVSRFLERQAERDRLLWLLHRWHGLSLSETATAAGTSLATVKRRIAGVDARLDAWRTVSGVIR